MFDVWQSVFHSVEVCTSFDPTQLQTIGYVAVLLSFATAWLSQWHWPVPLLCSASPHTSNWFSVRAPSAPCHLPDQWISSSNRLQTFGRMCWHQSRWSPSGLYLQMAQSRRDTGQGANLRRGRQRHQGLLQMPFWCWWHAWHWERRTRSTSCCRSTSLWCTFSRARTVWFLCSWRHHRNGTREKRKRRSDMCCHPWPFKRWWPSWRPLRNLSHRSPSGSTARARDGSMPTAACRTCDGISRPGNWSPRRMQPSRCRRWPGHFKTYYAWSKIPLPRSGTTVLWRSSRRRKTRRFRGSGFSAAATMRRRGTRSDAFASILPGNWSVFRSDLRTPTGHSSPRPCRRPWAETSEAAPEPQQLLLCQRLPYWPCLDDTVHGGSGHDLLARWWLWTFPQFDRRWMVATESEDFQAFLVAAWCWLDWRGSWHPTGCCWLLSLVFDANETHLHWQLLVSTTPVRCRGWRSERWIRKRLCTWIDPDSHLWFQFAILHVAAFDWSLARHPRCLPCSVQGWQSSHLTRQPLHWTGAKVHSNGRFWHWDPFSGISEWWQCAFSSLCDCRVHCTFWVYTQHRTLPRSLTLWQPMDGIRRQFIAWKIHLGTRCISNQCSDVHAAPFERWSCQAKSSAEPGSFGVCGHLSCAAARVLGEALIATDAAWLRLRWLTAAAGCWSSSCAAAGMALGSALRQLSGVLTIFPFCLDVFDFLLAFCFWH